MENLPKALVRVHLLRWIATYPVDKVIHSLNKWGQIVLKLLKSKLFIKLAPVFSRKIEAKERCWKISHG